jgi:hypothetical protein
MTVASTPEWSCLKKSGSGGVVKADCAILGDTISSTASVFSVNFKALTGSGSTTLNLTGTAKNSGVDTNPASTSAKVSFTTPVSGGGGSNSDNNSDDDSDTSSGSGTSSGGDTTTTDTKKKESTKKTIDTAKAAEITASVSDVQFNAVSVQLSASKPFTAYIAYGIGDEDQFALRTPSTKLTKSQTVKLDSKHLLSGTTYSYQVIAVDPNGDKTEGPIATFKTKGYSLRVKILDNNNKPLAKKTVTLFSEPIEAKTDSQGVAEFSDVAAGTHHVVYDVGQVKHSQAVVVEENFTTSDGGEQVAVAQNAAVIYEELEQPASLAWLLYLVLIFVLIGGGFMILKRRTTGGGSKGSGTFGGTITSTPTTPSSDSSSDSSSATTETDLLQKISGADTHAPGHTITPSGGEK